jgi:hypothetical protein
VSKLTAEQLNELTEFILFGGLVEEGPVISQQLTAAGKAVPNLPEVDPLNLTNHPMETELDSVFLEDEDTFARIVLEKDDFNECHNLVPG